MENKAIRIIRLLYLLGDLFLLNFAFLLMHALRFEGAALSGKYLLLLAYFNFTWVFIALFLGNYQVSRLDSYSQTVRKMLQSILWHFFTVTAIFVFVKTIYFSRLHLGLTYISFTFLVLTWRIAAIYFNRVYHRRGYNLARIVMVGYNDLSITLANYLKQHPELGYRFMGFFDDKSDNSRIKGKINDLPAYVKKHKIDEIYCSLANSDSRKIRELVKFADDNLLRIKMIPNLHDFPNQRFRLENYGDIPVLLHRDEPLSDYLNLLVKRLFDIAFASFVILFILSWLVPLIALIIRIDSPGPIFFIQKRSGRKNRKFACFKFRTMRYSKNAEFVQASRNDSRITRVGRILRKTNLDEMPQFFNVLLGDMTIVGPRPHPVELDESFKAVVDKYMVRHFVKPGITGLAQVKGYRGETRDVRSMINRIRMDVFYIENWSFWFDVKIIFLTVLRMVKGDRSAF